MAKNCLTFLVKTRCHNTEMFSVVALDEEQTAEECLMFLQPGALSQVFMPFVKMPNTLLVAAFLPLSTTD